MYKRIRATLVPGTLAVTGRFDCTPPGGCIMIVGVPFVALIGRVLLLILWPLAPV
ncbi:MAG: hypothetical protein V3S15_03280 [Woeseiaceae bacterium]